MSPMHELEELTAPALAQLLATGVSTVIVPFGSLEDHGAHLPMGADAVLADAVSREVARALGAVRAPAVHVGHAPRTGVLTLRADTLTDVAVQLVDGLTRQGFTRIALVSTHGGNRAALDAAVGGAGVCAPRGDVGPRPGTHSGEWLTSVMLALRPDLVRLEHAPAALADEVRAASAERGRRHLERFVASIVAAVRAP
jgi:creatinine amidohydrolase/Fe(II)-dependent formamide hydrolase-like protein